MFKKLNGKRIISLFLTAVMVFSMMASPKSAGENLSAIQDLPDHMIINQYYGANYAYAQNSDTENAVKDTPISHSFVELYNPTDEDIDLGGWSLQFADIRSGWLKLELEGTIPSKHSFLVRANATQTIAPGKGVDVAEIPEGDMEWDLNFNSKGSKIVLLQSTELLTFANPFNTDGNGTKATGYVDMFGVGGNDIGDNDIIDGYETGYQKEQSKQKSFRRIEFTDTDNNYDDFMIVDYRLSAFSQWAKPHTVSDGAWTSSGTVPKQPNETVMDPLKPTALTNFFGTDPKTTRVFTWQTPETVTSGNIQYSESPNFTNPVTVNAVRTVEETEDGTVSIFRATVTGLKAGTTYSYRAGNSVGYSDTFSFTTEGTGEFTFMHISDSQSTTQLGYKTFGLAIDAITAAYPNLAFFLETGDLIDTVDREDEWRGYFGSTSMFGNFAFAPVVGNHEQIRGNEAASFKQHFTVPANGASEPVTQGTTYSFDYGDAHFVVLNSESDLSTQKTWLENDLKNTDKKWKIVAMHRGVYGQNDKSDLFDAFAGVFDKYNVALVLNGHDPFISELML